jgi:hypothetical protein
MGVSVRGKTIVASVEMYVEECCNCGIIFAMTEDFHQEKLKHRNNDNRRSFYCPNGHAQWYLGETEEQKLKRELEQAKKDRDWYDRNYAAARKEADHQRRRANGYKGHATRITKRVKAGVCICCNRTFQDLARHMATKHPQLTPQESVEEPFILREGADAQAAT